jgi:hypothetical protein
LSALTTLLRFRNEILEAPETTETDANPDAVNAFSQIWQAALEIGRKGSACGSPQSDVNSPLFGVFLSTLFGV